ncbi:ABC transporter permease [Desulfohalobium retbaense]|uniref:Binding-protein-dependent transport systems inner membrane component n=1 Tax=Desulfohalobium retbaense (strain ATCC 49708 / DSM 5692 / JCM 16813 / HR100) TaxID=485915 RepID=C8WYQ7_DESRD|nr:ABC transporter permease [Desulfohalobium retbaense]ACV67823.1 binding-protein-dependent transport systems inner membrane component [Desulfohalobium retbaense DSM 5692]
MLKRDPFSLAVGFSGSTILLFILLPLLQMVVQPSLPDMAETIRDPAVRKAIGLSLFTSGMAAVIALVLGTPLAYILARKDFWGKRVVESVIDLPIMIPHPVIGIAILSLAGRGHWLGDVLQALGVKLMGTTTGIVVVLTFVGVPFYVNAAKAGFEVVPARLEHVARTLGASRSSAFYRVTLPLAFRSLLAGTIMCMARAISEFGAVVIVAYHPMVAPVLIYERFTAYGLKYSQPVAVWLILVSLFLFLLLRIVTARGGGMAGRSGPNLGGRA